MKFLGMALIVFGLVDLVGSYTAFDLWDVIGIELPRILWQFSSYIEIVLGYFLMKMGSNETEEAE